MPHIISEKIKIGVSACNFGSRVRYNRKGWDRVSELDREKDSFHWTPVCPEVLSGMGVPREPIRLSGGNGDDFWNGDARIKNKRGKEVSDLVREGANAAMAALKRAAVEAFVFMEGSPSCGVYRTTLKNRRLGKPPGAFGSLLLKEAFFLIPADDLQSPLKWWDWRRRLHAFVWLKRREIKSKKDLTDTWHDLKFVCQESSRSISDQLGRDLAGMPKKISGEFISEIKLRILQILRLPSTLKRIQNSAEKQMVYYGKHFNMIIDEKLPKAVDGKLKFVKKLREFEKRSLDMDIGNSLVPVIYRDERRK